MEQRRKEKKYRERRKENRESRTERVKVKEINVKNNVNWDRANEKDTIYKRMQMTKERRGQAEERRYEKEE